MRFSPVGSINGASFDLVVTVAPGSNYNCASPCTQNTLNGKFGQIRLLYADPLGVATLRFSFVDTATGASVTVPSFYFSFFDLDMRDGNGDRSEAVGVKGSDIAGYMLDPSTEVSVACNDGSWGSGGALHVADRERRFWDTHPLYIGPVEDEVPET